VVVGGAAVLVVRGHGGHGQGDDDHGQRGAGQWRQRRRPPPGADERDQGQAGCRQAESGAHRVLHTQGLGFAHGIHEGQAHRAGGQPGEDKRRVQAGTRQRDAAPWRLEGDRSPGHLGDGRQGEQHDHHAVAAVRPRGRGMDQPRPCRRQR
jgi:hypothetical protein